MKYAFIAFMMIVAGTSALGGYSAGQYVTTQQYQKAAVAHSCGMYDKSTLGFSWIIPADVGLVLDAMPDVSLTQNKKAGAK